MKKINIDLKYFILLIIIVFAAIIPTYAHHGHFLIDCGREAYYPTQILLGKVLYKDILNIYGPFSYLFNAILFKVFGFNLNVLYIAGCISTMFISWLIYLIAKRFLSPFLSFSIAVFTILTGVLTHYLSNFIFPYSYAMLYGIVSFLFSVLFLLKYEADKKNKYLYISSFFAGLCIANKYEFVPYLIVILYAMIKVKPLGFKQYFYTVFLGLFMPALCFGILFLQGLGVNDIINTLLIYRKMAQSHTLQYFYGHSGVYFSPNMLQAELFVTAKTLLVLAGFYTGFNMKNKFLSTFLIILSSFLIIMWTNPLSFSLIPLLIVVFAILDIKNIKSNIQLQLLVLSAVCLSFKVFWGLITADYGLFLIGFLLITIIALIKDKFRYKSINYKAIGIYLILSATVLSLNNLDGNKELPIKTSRGNIYAETSLANSSLELIDYINKKTNKNDTIVILPEGAMINFITQRQTDNYYTSLIPLYVEVFGETNIINHFKQTRPEYIIFNNWNTNEYYFAHICQDYAVSFCNYVAANYKEEKVIGNDFRYLIFKRK